MSITPNVAGFAKDITWPPAKYNDGNRAFVPLVDIGSQGKTFPMSTLRQVEEGIEVVGNDEKGEKGKLIL